MRRQPVACHESELQRENDLPLLEITNLHVALEDGTEVVAGTWNDGRVGTFRGLRAGAHGYGATVYGDKGIAPSGGYDGYEPLAVEIVKFFKSGKPPVSAEETLEIYAFMEAADESKRQGGAPVTIESVLAKARAAAESSGRAAKGP